MVTKEDLAQAILEIKDLQKRQIKIPENKKIDRTKLY